MKQLSIIFFTWFLFNSYGCEQEIIDPNLPYKETLVIRGIVTDGDIIDSLYIGRTLPYEEFPIPRVFNDTAYRPPERESYVKDAVVTITSDARIYVLTYAGSGLYKNNSLIGKTGKTYRLSVEWKGKKAEAVTTIPAEPLFDSVHVTVKNSGPSSTGSNTEYHCKAFARTSVNNVFSFEVKYRTTNIFRDSLKFINEFGYGSTVKKRTQPDITIPDSLSRILFPFYDNFSGTDPQLVFQLRNFDEPYYRFHASFSSEDGENDFSIGPQPVAWNVAGDAIGMFIGASKQITKVLPLH